MPGRLGPVDSAMGPGDCGRSREGMPRGRRGVEVGLWPRAPRPALRFPGPDEGVDVRERVGAASRRLEDLRRRLARAFQRAVPRGRSRRPREAVAAETPSGARGESALDQLRAELVSAPWRPQERPSAGLPAAGRGPRGPPEGSEARELFRNEESEGVQRRGARHWPSISPGRSPRVPIRCRLTPPHPQHLGGKGSYRIQGAGSCVVLSLLVASPRPQ